MMSAAAVLVYALSLLGRSAASMPPIELLDVRPADVSLNAEAFVRRDPETIYILTTTASFKDAQAGNYDALRKIASILVHEEWHIRNGPDEQGAYEAQLMTLMRLGVPVDSNLRHGVARAMLSVIDRRR